MSYANPASARLASLRLLFMQAAKVDVLTVPYKGTGRR